MSYEYSEGYKIRNQSATHFLTFTIEGWIDIFSRKEYRDMIIDSFNYCRSKKQLKIHGFVIMTNHIHTIWTAQNGNLSDIVRDFKTHTSKLFVNYIRDSSKESRKEWLLHMFQFYANQVAKNKYFKVWKSNSHPEEIISKDFFLQKLSYIHDNPVRAGMVAQHHCYLYSSASNYINNCGLMDIDFLF